ncbi:pheA operon leader peptide PheL [Salmonella enterica]|nr:pheA operon leader peptide PheL [Salmonella enterica]EJJ4099111.1 pheA operon leader peptide PheL [Salmonella enterica]EJJ4388234.1 pheA operon leader peptide PheL [Salmonella enterica]EJJ4396953.1 pheA operon leader peptide PheL [Salmonella enterica]EJJ4432293.1 pheA operon leader peptide PheL [Salmonella enterica]
MKLARFFFAFFFTLP